MKKGPRQKIYLPKQLFPAVAPRDLTVAAAAAVPCGMPALRRDAPALAPGTPEATQLISEQSTQLCGHACDTVLLPTRPNMRDAELLPHIRYYGPGWLAFGVAGSQRRPLPYTPDLGSSRCLEHLTALKLAVEIIITYHIDYEHGVSKLQMSGDFRTARCEVLISGMAVPPLSPHLRIVNQSFLHLFPCMPRRRYIMLLTAL